MTKDQKIRAALAELLRLYDWRNELGLIERDFNHDRKQMKTWLNQYGREKKQAWAVARELLQYAESQDQPMECSTSLKAPADAAPIEERIEFKRLELVDLPKAPGRCWCGWSGKSCAKLWPDLNPQTTDSIAPYRCYVQEHYGTGGNT